MIFRYLEYLCFAWFFLGCMHVLGYFSEKLPKVEVEALEVALATTNVFVGLLKGVTCRGPCGASLDILSQHGTIKGVVTKVHRLGKGGPSQEERWRAGMVVVTGEISRWQALEALCVGGQVSGLHNMLTIDLY